MRFKARRQAKMSWKGGEGERDGRRKGERERRLHALEVTLDLWPKGCGAPL